MDKPCGNTGCKAKASHTFSSSLGEGTVTDLCNPCLTYAILTDIARGAWFVSAEVLGLDELEGAKNVPTAGEPVRGYVGPPGTD